MAKQFEIDEDYVELNVVDIAERHGRFVRKVNWQGRRNAPDRVFAHETYDRDIWIEFKAPGEAPRSGQRLEHDKMRKAGMTVYVCDRIDDACRVLGLPVPRMTPEGRLI